MNKLKTLTMITLALFILGSCEKDEIETSEIGYATTGGAIIVNEGGFQLNNGSISYVSPEGEVSNNVFAAVNGRDLGDVVISYLKVADKGIITVNNSQKVEIVETETFSSVKTITQDLSYPRFALNVTNSKVYVTNGSSEGTIVVINLDDYTVTKTIDVGQGPNELLALNGKVYVANSGGFGTDSTISVIDPDTDQEISKITVANTPEALVVDANSNLWVLCAGTQDFGNFPAVTMLTPSKLVQIDPSSNSVVNEITLVPQNSEGDVERLAISKDGLTLYYLKNTNIYSHDISASTASTQPLIAGEFYGLDVNPSTGEIWAATNGFTENQQVEVYSTSGSLVATYDVGIGASNSIFNQ